MPPRIFISYRRADAAGDAGRLADHVVKRFGAGRVFLDVDTIDPGVDFARVLRESLAQTAVMLVVIGPNWTSLRAADGSRRLDDPNDFVRMEVEAALGRDIPVVPVLVQGASVPRAADLPASLAPLANRQAAAIDHAEFHDDAERLCDRLARVIEGNRGGVRRWWPAAALAAAVLLALAGYFAFTPEAQPGTASTAAENAGAPAAVENLLAEASAQRRRNQHVEALATLARARELAPDATAVRDLQEDVAMEWIRTVGVESGTSSFGDAIAPAVAVVDRALPSAEGTRRADLLAHAGWAAFLRWRDGDRRLDPAQWYREALSADPGNPYANAMLAHWILFQGDDIPEAVKLFDRATGATDNTDNTDNTEKTKRADRSAAAGAVRDLQWAAYGNDGTPESEVQLVRLADRMRRDGVKLSMRQAQMLWGPFYFALPPARMKERQELLEALPPDDYISTLAWAFDEYVGKDEARRLTMRYYVALQHARAGRQEQAIAELRTLNTELARQSGPLKDAVAAQLRQAFR
jgi:hypothetical protein